MRDIHWGRSELNRLARMAEIIEQVKRFDPKKDA
jgi:hypothetical protein